MRKSDRSPKTSVGSDDRRTRHPEDNSEDRRPACPPGRFCLGKWAPPLLALTMSFVAAPGWASERLVQNDGSSGVGTPRAGEVPEGVSAEAWEAISGAIERDRYRAERREDGTVSAANRAQAYTTRFTREGIRVRPQGAGMGAGVEVGLTLAGYGYSQTQPVEAAEPQAKGNRVEFHRGTLTEWYVNRAAGLEQGFTLEEPPLETPQQARTRAGGREPLRLELAVAGPVRVERTEDGEAVLLRDPEGRVRLRYGGLRAWDATGRELASRLEAGGGRIALLVEDAAARYPLTIDPTILNEAAKLTAGDAAAFDNFGQSVSISGDTLVVGALHDECTPSGIDCGAAYVFEKPAGGWAGTLTQDAKLTASDAAAGDFFSRSVSISGGTVVVGAWTHDCTPSGNDCGAAYVFEKPALGWADGTQDAKLTASDAAASDFFGRSVSISGGTVVVGAWSDDCTPSGLNCGSAYVFEKPALGWADGTQDAKLTASDAAVSDTFGLSVSISGNTVVVGAQRDDCTPSGLDCGSAYVFEKPALGWADGTQDAKLTASDAAASDLFGFSVTISGETVVVGAYFDNCTPSGNECGSAYVFEKPAAGWADAIQDAKLTASDAAAFDFFGQSVSISGDTVVAGAQRDDCTPGSNCGAAYVFEKPALGWADGTQDAKLTASDAAANDRFGSSVAISGNTVVVGASGDDCTPSGNDCGSAYVFLGPFLPPPPPVNVLQDCWTTSLNLDPDPELELYTFTTADSIDFVWKQKLQETCSAYLASIWVFQCIAGKPLPGAIVQVFHDISLGQQDPVPGTPEPLLSFSAPPGSIPRGVTTGRSSPSVTTPTGE